MPRKSKCIPEVSFYRELGSNLRVARSSAGKTQNQVARHLDVTFQQVQKYENGKDRIPVDRLLSVAAYLEVPFQQLIAPSERDAEFQTRARQFGAKEFHALMEAWGSIKDRPLRAALLGIVRRMADLKC